MARIRRDFGEVGFVNEAHEARKLLSDLRAGWLDRMGAIRRLAELNIKLADCHKLVDATMNG